MLETILRTPDEQFAASTSSPATRGKGDSLVSTIGLASDRALGARRAFFGPLTRLLNPSIRRLAGRSGMPLVGLVHHQGRRSGRTYATPVAVGSTGTAFLIPLTFGAASDWCRNVLAAGGCTIEWGGSEYAADQAEVVDDVYARAELPAAFGPLVRLQLRAMGTHRFLRLRLRERRPSRRARQPSGRPSAPSYEARPGS